MRRNFLFPHIWKTIFLIVKFYIGEKILRWYGNVPDKKYDTSLKKIKNIIHKARGMSLVLKKMSFTELWVCHWFWEGVYKEEYVTGFWGGVHKVE